MTRQRLDQVLVARGLYPSRARARDAIGRGEISVGGRVETRQAHLVDDDVEIAVSDAAARYVSRSALKLAAALDAFELSPEGMACLDIGASTGGFTQVLIERGAAHVTAIDVGHGQMHDSLRNDPRVTTIEGLNAREMTADNVAHAIEFLVADVSFISLTLALPPALDLAVAGCPGVFLVKPQFEVGRDRVGKGGIVREPAHAMESLVAIEAWLEALGWPLIGRIASPITGGDGNQEFLVAARKRA